MFCFYFAVLYLLFKHPVLNELAGIIDIEQQNKNKTLPLIIPKAKKREYYKLSHAQRRMFVLYKLNPESFLYNAGVILRPEKDINIEQLERAIASIMGNPYKWCVIDL